MLAILKNRVALVATVVAAAAVASCRPTPAASNDTAATPSNAAQPALPAASSTAAPAGPDILTTVGSYDGSLPVTHVVARQGTFAIEKLGDSDTLTVGGKAASFKTDGLDGPPSTVEANNSISLIGVFELPHESVAYVVIMGGTACPATHVLVGARGGIALPGQGIPGCGESGTMRKVGDTITFEAGGSSGTYKDGVVTVTDKAAGFDAPPPSQMLTRP